MPRNAYTYGVLPPFEVFDEYFYEHVGDGEFRIRLSSSDARAAQGTIIADDAYDSHELYKGVKQLTKKWERGDDAAGDLASSILSVLGFEWI